MHSPQHCSFTTNPIKQDMELHKLLTLYFFISYFFLSQPSQATTNLPGVVRRTTKQQILASIPPASQENTIPFITSPSGKYTAYFLRRDTAPGAGGFGSEFCYIQVQDTTTQSSMWESECSPVSTVNTCALVFSWNGLEVFDGSNSIWNNEAQSADNNFLQTLELVDEGDMRIRDKDGELAWKASDDPRENQRCGLPGSPGLAPALPPFAQPVGYDKNLPFGQSSEQEQQQLPQPGKIYNQQQPQAPVTGESQAFGLNSQPLVDNSPYDSGCIGGLEHWLGMGVGLVVSFLIHGFIF
ncbi:uncharacterized protein [Typha angustifolia]|uniref:uncharacterized protein n=1 Tax=Typha angustifolia TaxID=59011 RepID=UPI003C2CD7A9